MDKLSVRAHGDNLRPQLLELLILLCQSTKLCRSYKCEVCRIEEKYGPFASLLELFEGDLSKKHLIWIIGIHFKIRDTLPQMQSITALLCAHIHYPPHFGILGLC